MEDPGRATVNYTIKDGENLVDEVNNVDQSSFPDSRPIVSMHGHDWVQLGSEYTSAGGPVSVATYCDNTSMYQGSVSADAMMLVPIRKPILNLSMDSNNDGTLIATINGPDDREEMGLTGQIVGANATNLTPVEIDLFPNGATINTTEELVFSFNDNLFNLWDSSDNPIAPGDTLTVTSDTNDNYHTDVFLEATTTSTTFTTSTLQVLLVGQVSVNDKAKVSVATIDIYVDSNNDGKITAADDPTPDPSSPEVPYEEQSPGKLLAVGIGQRTPVRLKANLKKGFSSNGITFSITYDDKIRLYYNKDPNANTIPSGKKFTNDKTVDQLLSNGASVFMDGIELGEADITIKLLDANGTKLDSDTVRVTVGLDLDTDSSNNGTIESTENIEDLNDDGVVEDIIEVGQGSLGKIAFVNGAAKLAKVSFSGVDLSSTKFAGYSVRLLADAGLNLWADEAKTQALSPLTWSGSALVPSTIYVEGTTNVDQYLHWQFVAPNDTILAEDSTKFRVVDNYCVNWAQHDESGTDKDGRPLLDNPVAYAGGKAIFPEKKYPHDINTNFKTVDLIISRELDNSDPENTPQKTVYLRVLDPKNAKTSADNKHKIEYTYKGQAQSTDKVLAFQFLEGEPEVRVHCSLLGSAPGDNFIAVVDEVKSKVTNAKLGKERNKNCYQVFKDNGSGGPDLDNTLSHSKLLTVWRTLWMELDQMEKPEGPGDSDSYKDGFNIEFKAGYDANGKWRGTWGTEVPKNETEPDNFDILAQPKKPDISIVQSAMADACIAVKEVDQVGSAIKWTSSNDASDAKGAWDLTSPFERTLGIHSVSKSELWVSLEYSQDVKHSMKDFWSIHALGAYNPCYGRSWDTDTISSPIPPILGMNYGPYASFVLFEETIRDFQATVRPGESDDVNTPVSLEEMRQFACLHETLHSFMFTHTESDGRVMFRVWTRFYVLIFESNCLPLRRW